MFARTAFLGNFKATENSSHGEGSSLALASASKHCWNSEELLCLMEGTSMAVLWPWTLTACLASLCQMAGYALGHIDIQELEVSPVSLLSSQAWKLLEALIDKGM